jgi:hypothetical protein
VASAGHRLLVSPANTRAPRHEAPKNRAGEVVALRPLAFYDAVARRIAVKGAAA